MIAVAICQSEFTRPTGPTYRVTLAAPPSTEIAFRIEEGPRSASCGGVPVGLSQWEFCDIVTAQRLVVSGIVLFDRIGGIADERDLNGGEKIVTERGHGPQVAGDSRTGLVV